MADTAAISACERAGKWEEALALLSQMEEAAISPDVHVLNACIGACAKAGEVTQAMRLLRDEFARLGLAPDVSTQQGVTARSRA